MNKQQFIEKFNQNFRGKYEGANKDSKSAWSSKAIDSMLEDIDSALSECWDMAGEEERNSIAEKYGDFRVVRKWGLGLVKYGKALRFFLLPHTKHKEGDDDTQF